MKLIPTSTDDLYYSRHTRREPLTLGEWLVIGAIVLSVLAVMAP